MKHNKINERLVEIMARSLIVGCCEPFSVKDKETEKQVKMCRVYVTRESMDTYGQKCEEVLLTTSNGGFQRIAEFENNVIDLVGLECDVDRNTKGKLENFALIMPKAVEKAVKA